MSVQSPILYKKETEAVIRAIDEELRRILHAERWQGAAGGRGMATLQLFGRMAEVIRNRLNQTPEQHFRAFLNEAEIEPLSPHPAYTELTFTPIPDGPDAIAVPAGTQVSTRASDKQPEIVFETERNLFAIPAALFRCIPLDPVNYSDRTDQANDGAPESFAMFAGDVERTRELYISDTELLTFSDAASRGHATLTLRFVFEQPGANEDGWKIEWFYWSGDAWASLSAAGALIADGTDNFTRDGELDFTNLPEPGVTVVNGVAAPWLLCRLGGGKDRAHMPVIRSLEIGRTIVIPEQQTVIPDTIFAAIQAGTAFNSVDHRNTFFPFGQQPVPFDACYFRIDEAFTKPGANVTLNISLDDLPDTIEDTSELDKLCIEWSYYSTAGWTLLGTSRRGCPELERLGLENVSPHKPVLKQNPLTRRKYLDISLPDEVGELPPALAQYSILTDIYSGAKYIEIPLPEKCANLPEEILVNGCSTAKQPGFKDKTCAFTTSGIVQFVIPDEKHSRTASATTQTEQPESLPFAEIEINGQTGCWLRAQIVAGSYNEPQEAARSLVARLLLATPQWLPPKTYPPAIQALDITYRGYQRLDALRLPPCCHSKIDMEWRDHSLTLKNGQSIAPFTTTIERAALYLGFAPFPSSAPRPALPPGRWIQLLMGVDETTSEQEQPVKASWQYWNGDEWRDLRVVDGTQGFIRREYVGFYAPTDHRASTEFGHSAFWLRVLPDDTSVKDRQLRQRKLREVRLNTTPAINAETITNELIGSSNGEPSQRFRLTRAPVLPDIELEVREPETMTDHQPTNTRSPAGASTMNDAPATIDHETWVRWQPVPSFYGCEADSRCFLFDPVRGDIRFGNGKQGQIPPAGRDNIRVRRYRTHHGAGGNQPVGAVNQLRNPSAELSEIRRVVNMTPASGGLDAETIEDAKRRGPQSLKHRQRPVTAEDFQWIALESEQVARAYCLPTWDASNHWQPGWVTLVVVPETTAGKPTPSWAQLRQVRGYLEGLALANLRQFETLEAEGIGAVQTVDTDQIHVKAPQYLDVTVSAGIVPVLPEKADDIKLAVLRKLEAFLHPLSGGHAGEGWEPGRDIFISEIAAEIEDVPGVDYIETLSLSVASLQLQSLILTQPASPAVELPAGSQVGTFDERIRVTLARTLPKDEPSDRVVIYGFGLGGQVHVVQANGQPLATNQTIARLEHGNNIHFEQPLLASAEWENAAALVSVDGRLQMEIDQCLIRRDADGRNQIIGIVVRAFAAGDAISVVHLDRRRHRLDFLRIDRIESGNSLERIFVPHDHLVCSGDHAIEMKVEMPDVNTVA